MELKVQPREILGKKVKALRKQGLIPAELYGHGLKNVHLNVPAKEFLKLFKEVGESTIIKLELTDDRGTGENKNEFNVLIHDVQKDSLTDEIINIDFYQVRMDQKITVPVPLEFVGEAPAVKEKGGVLIKAIYEIELEALPADLPHNIEVNLNGLLDIGMSIHIKDIKFPKGVEILLEPETVVATVTEPAKEEVVEKPISVEEVKVEGEEKKEEEKKDEQKKEEGAKEPGKKE